MDPNEIPPLINPPEPGPEPKVSRWRWWIHLAVLTAFPLLVGTLSLRRMDTLRAPILPANVRGLLTVSFFELVFFGALFALAWVASRVNAKQLLLKWRGGGSPFLWGLAYSIALRVGIAVVVIIVVALWFGITGAQVSEAVHSQPRLDRMINADAMTGHPLYLILLLTLVSFVVAGLREELWRAGMLAGISALFPRGFSTLGGRAVAVLAVAVVFGLGHTAQGWSGVVVTGLLGAGLGGIMLRHRSIWEAVLAHGFFDASTFLFLYLLAKLSPQYLPHG